MSSGLSLISVGLSSEKDLSLKALEEGRSCDLLYFEAYTSKLNTSMSALRSLFGKDVTELKRSDLEEGSREIIEKAKNKRIGILVGGDCLTATTHISLIIEAKKIGVPTRIIHGSSILTAVAETGLSLYKFGRTVTMPLSDKGSVDPVIEAVCDNLEQGLHTLILLDLDVESGRFVTVGDALKALIKSDDREQINDETLVVGLSRLGWDESLISVGRASEIAEKDFGEPPYALIIPGRLHFVEEEALHILHGCPKELLKERRVLSQIDELISKYASSCERVINELKMRTLPKIIHSEDAEDLINHARRYLDDALYFASVKKPTALVSISYCEGILDALKLLGLVDFEW
ncbi:diphthine synthase [Candidatus Bathyarchaeota archaeon]|nr:diphthine synthase [Candidatus Bathyarchaeota archaeon]MBS7631741.1 diphthine synthase [Candidatus Bathyarchaeota archaeon]